MLSLIKHSSATENGFICVHFKKTSCWWGHNSPLAFLMQIFQPSVGRELFAAGFASCWAQMNETSQEQLVRSLKTAFSSQNIPPEILATLLNLVNY
jgi:phosphatidylinositol kinase/protein kinase (PI-3  family)